MVLCSCDNNKERCLERGQGEAVCVFLDLTYLGLASFETNSAVFSPLPLALINNILFRAPIIINILLNQAIFFLFGEDKTKVTMVSSHIKEGKAEKIKAKIVGMYKYFVFK